MVSGRKVRWGLRVLFLAGMLSACTSAGSEPDTASTTTSVAVSNESCQSTPTESASVPAEVRDWAHGTGVVGNAGLWSLIPDASAFEPRQDAASGQTFYGLKLAWYRQFPGRLDVSAIRVSEVNDPEWASVQVPSGYPATGFQPSGIIFASAGCWRIVGHLAGSTQLTFFLVSVP